MALPLLDAMSSSLGTATGLHSALARSNTDNPAKNNPPTRMAFVFSPNGVITPDWKPKQLGANYHLPPTLTPLAEVKNDLLVLSGLTQDKARAHGDGGGDHARCSAAFLTGVQPYKTNGADIRAGISVDQLTAQQVGKRTRLPSLELGTDPGRLAGNCDSGYSCAYVTNIAWASPSTPVPKEINPRIVFERLFGAGDMTDARRNAQRDVYRQSILDLVKEDAQRLAQHLGAGDRRKLEEYFTSVREIELRIDRAMAQRESEWTPDYEKPRGIPGDFKAHIRLMYDLMVLAFQGDVTRISTFMLARAGSNRSYPAVGVPQGHHALSHHKNDQDKIDQLKKIDRFHVEQFAYLVNKLKSVKEADGTLLDHCMVLYGSGIADGNRHSHHDLPILLAGRAGGTIEPGRHLRYARETPLNNLYLSMMDRMGAHVDTFGDSTARLTDLTG